MTDSGDAEAAVEALYRRWSTPLLGYALSWSGGDRQGAEGLVNEAFECLWLQWGSVRAYNDAGRYGWLKKVVLHRGVSAYRSRQLLPQLVDPVEESHRLDRPCPDVDPVHRMLAADLLDRCIAVIRELPEGPRVAILLRAEGYTASQVARMTGRPVSTVKTYWQRAKRALTVEVGDVIGLLDDDVVDRFGDDVEGTA